MKTILIGEDSFRALITKNAYYVDKTAFIKEILDNFGGTKLFLRPRRFGKTTNMLMLKEYFDITKKEENKDLFKGLYIETLGEEYQKHKSAYPVIFMTFKESDQSNWEDMYGNIKGLIKTLYKEHKYVRSELEDFEQEEYNNIMTGKAEYVEYQNALKTLMSYLHQYHNKNVIVLIDEYDAPLNASYINGFGEKAIGFMQTFLSGALKTNEYLEVGVLTGVLQIGQQSIFSKLNNFDVYSVLREQASEYFGFTKEEVKQMLKDFNVEERYEEIEKWYNGYNLNGVQIFNPWSILNCIDNKGECEPYWVNTGKTNLIDLATEGISADIAEAVGKLLKCMPVEVRLKQKAVYEEIQGNLESFLNTLLFTGYLTVDKKYMKDDERFGNLRIPNKEIRKIIEKMQNKWLPVAFKDERIEKICKAVIEQDEEELKNHMEKLVKEEVSYFSSSEDYYKGMFMTAMLSLPKEYIASSENETGYGRSDYEIYKEDKSVGMVYEFKVCNSQRTLEEAVEEGMEQIYDNEYYTRMQKLGVKEIWLYSMAFCQKKMLIKKEKVEI